MSERGFYIIAEIGNNDNNCILWATKPVVLMRSLDLCIVISQATHVLVDQRGEHQTWMAEVPRSILTGIKIYCWIFCFHIVNKAFIVNFVCENSESDPPCAQSLARYLRAQTRDPVASPSTMVYFTVQLLHTVPDSQLRHPSPQAVTVKSEKRSGISSKQILSDHSARSLATSEMYTQLSLRKFLVLLWTKKSEQLICFSHRQSLWNYLQNRM